MRKIICIFSAKIISLHFQNLGVSTNYSTWRHIDNDTKQQTQIDLVIDRKDNVINLCEMKYSQKKYEETTDSQYWQ
jgi:hypothetical protein